jgi:hypothetical protein
VAAAAKLKIPDGLDDEDVLFLSDILPTGYQAAEQGDIHPGDTVVGFGCGPVGLFAQKSSGLLGAARVIAVDCGIVVTTVCPGLMRTGSPRNATFEGRHRADYAWFAIGDSLVIGPTTGGPDVQITSGPSRL